MLFHKISVPTSWTVKRGGGLRDHFFFKESLKPNWNYQRGGARDGYFLEQHNTLICLTLIPSTRKHIKNADNTIQSPNE